MRSRHIYSVLFIAILGCNLHASEVDFEIELAPTKFVLPAFSEEYSDRESTIAPEEYELAEELKALLGNKDFDAVKSKLESYYDLELSTAILAVKAQVYFAIKDYANAEKTYLSVLKRKPQLVRVHEELGQLYLITRQFEKAQTHFAKAISYGSASALVHGQLGYLNLQRNGAFSAIYAYQKALTLEPTNQAWQQGLLTALLACEMLPSANALLNDLIKQNPQQQSLWLNKAAIELKLKQPEAALEAVEHALLLGDVSVQNLQVAARLHLKLKSYDRALALINKHLTEHQVSVQNVKEYLYWLNQAQRWQDSERILEQFMKSAEIEPKDKSELAYYRANIYLAKKQITKAKAEFKAALRYDPNNALAILDYAKLLLEQQQLIESESLFMRAQAFAQTRLHAKLGLVQLYVNSEDIQAAYHLLLEVKNQYPDTAGISQQLEIIENLAKLNDQTKV